MTPATEGTLERIERLSAERTKAQSDFGLALFALEQIAKIEDAKRAKRIAAAALSALTLSKESTHE